LSNDDELRGGDWVIDEGGDRVGLQAAIKVIVTTDVVGVDRDEFGEGGADRPERIAVDR